MLHAVASRLLVVSVPDGPEGLTMSEGRGTYTPAWIASAFGSGATHGAEAAYVFQNLLAPRPWTDLDHEVSDTISSYWVNFAANGDPNGSGLPKWPAYDDKKSDHAMVLGDTADLGPAPDPAQLVFFEALYQKQSKRDR